MNITVMEPTRNVRLTCLSTNKFKTSCLSISMLTQLGRETASLNALVPRVLRRGSVGHPNIDSIASSLDELYGAQIEPVIRKKGEVLGLGFFATFADEAYVPAQSATLYNTAKLVCEMLLSPVTRGGLLLPDYVESEKEKQLEQIRARINDKRAYSVQRLIELMCFSEDYAVDRLGDEGGVYAINYQKLTKRFRELLSSSPIEIFYCGSAEPERVASILRTELSTLPRAEPNLNLGTELRMNSIEENARVFDERLDVSQGKLALGFRLGECINNNSLAALRVFNAAYGGSVTSKLFENVRERLSLCYYAGSMIDRHKGLLIVSSGIEFDKYEQVKTEILAQLDAMRNGDITDDELLHAKRYIASDARATMDSPGALEDFYLSQCIDGLDYSPLDLAEATEAVTKDELVSIAQSVECDAIYFLHGEED